MHIYVIILCRKIPAEQFACGFYSNVKGQRQLPKHEGARTPQSKGMWRS